MPSLERLEESEESRLEEFDRLEPCDALMPSSSLLLDRSLLEDELFELELEEPFADALRLPERSCEFPRPVLVLPDAPSPSLRSLRSPMLLESRSLPLVLLLEPRSLPLVLLLEPRSLPLVLLLELRSLPLVLPLRLLDAPYPDPPDVDSESLPDSPFVRVAELSDSASLCERSVRLGFDEPEPDDEPADWLRSVCSFWSPWPDCLPEPEPLRLLV